MLDTDIRQGLFTNDVEARRRRFGWNEISTEKTNWLKQFLSYFMGPILWGTVLILLLLALADLVQLWKLPPCLLPVLGTGYVSSR